MAESTSSLRGLLHPGKLVFGADARIDQQRPGLVDRGLLLLRFQVFRSDVEVVADAGVRAKPEGLGFDEYRAFAVAHRFDHVLHAVVERGGIVAVEPHAAEAKRFSAAVEVLARRVLRDRRVFAPFVVLAQEDYRQLPRAGQVHRFVHGANRSRSVAEVNDGDAVLAALLGGNRKTVGNRRARADDGGRHHRAGCWIGNMRGAALALVDAVFAAKRFGKQVDKIDTLRHLVVDATIDGEHVVGLWWSAGKS